MPQPAHLDGFGGIWMRALLGDSLEVESSDTTIRRSVGHWRSLENRCRGGCTILALGTGPGIGPRLYLGRGGCARDRLISTINEIVSEEFPYQKLNLEWLTKTSLTGPRFIIGMPFKESTDLF